MPSIRLSLLLAASALLPLSALAQAPAAAPTATPAPTPASTTGWARVQQLPPSAHVHISTDTGGHTCNLFAVTEDSLTCAHHSKAGATYARSTVKSVKLTRYTISTLVGLSGGVGIGALIGKATVHKDTSTSGFRFDLSGLNIVAGGIIGGVAGAAIGGPTDFLRGPTVYRRP